MARLQVVGIGTSAGTDIRTGFIRRNRLRLVSSASGDFVLVGRRNAVFLINASAIPFSVSQSAPVGGIGTSGRPQWFRAKQWRALRAKRSASSPSALLERIDELRRLLRPWLEPTAF